MSWRSTRSWARSLPGSVHACSFWAIWWCRGRTGTGCGAPRPSSANSSTTSADSSRSGSSRGRGLQLVVADLDVDRRERASVERQLHDQRPHHVGRRHPCRRPLASLDGGAAEPAPARDEVRVQFGAERGGHHGRQCPGGRGSGESSGRRNEARAGAALDRAGGSIWASATFGDQRLQPLHRRGASCCGVGNALCPRWASAPRAASLRSSTAGTTAACASRVVTTPCVSNASSRSCCRYVTSHLPYVPL